MLKGAYDYPLQRGIDCLPGQCDSLDGQVVSLGATRGKRHLTRAAIEHLRDGGSRPCKRRGRRFTQAVVAGWVAKLAAKVRPHGFESLAPDRGGGCSVQEDHGSQTAFSSASVRSSISSPRSSAETLCVSPPIEMTSTPVAAISATVLRVTLPLASALSRPSTCLTPARSSSMEKLSSMMVSTPAASTGSI